MGSAATLRSQGSSGARVPGFRYAAKGKLQAPTVTHTYAKADLHADLPTIAPSIDSRRHSTSEAGLMPDV